jgi:putative ABC transport system permease protein
MLLPTIGAARHTIISYKQERARTIRAPWWQRAWLDVLLLIPAGYGVYLMRQQNGLFIPGQNPAAALDPFQNPLLLLVPALGIFALTLLILRLLPLLMALLAWLASKTSSVGLLMAARYLSRSAGGYNAPLILLVLTLSLSIFTSSLAQTLDKHVVEQTYYKIGADMNLDELGESTDTGVQEEPGQGKPANLTPAASNPADSGPEWLFLPVSEHLKIPGVLGAARVKRSTMNLTINGKVVSSDFLGIDRVDFSKVSYWRRDFAPETLGGLMNHLALISEGVLVSRDILNRGVRLGDNLQVSVFNGRESAKIDYKIVGVFDYFPTWYPGAKPLVVGNLDYYFEKMGGESPYEVWLKLSPAANPTVVTKQATQMYKKVLTNGITREDLYAAQSRPERQGFFGLLSVGFAALALLTILGFLLYAFFSFRQRFIELGMLRAIGLSAGQMIGFLGAELAFLFAVGLGAGTGLGVWVSSQFIPGLQVGNGMAARVPPFLVQIDWPAVFQIYILFGLLFLAALVILILLLLRMKIFQAIKLGEVT